MATPPATPASGLPSLEPHAFIPFIPMSTIMSAIQSGSPVSASTAGAIVMRRRQKKRNSTFTPNGMSLRFCWMVLSASILLDLDLPAHSLASGAACHSYKPPARVAYTRSRCCCTIQSVHRSQAQTSHQQIQTARQQSGQIISTSVTGECRRAQASTLSAFKWRGFTGPGRWYANTALRDDCQCSLKLLCAMPCCAATEHEDDEVVIIDDTDVAEVEVNLVAP